MGKALKYEYKGQIMTITELMRFSKVKRACLASRLLYGWDVEVALNEKANEKTLKHATSKTTVAAYVNKHNKKRKEKIHDTGVVPWLIGEKPLADIPSTKKDHYKLHIENHKKNIEKKCESCGASVWKSISQLRNYKDSSIRCVSCLRKGKEETKKALINLATNRKLI